MSAITSKAIVITAYPGKHGSITLPARNGEFILDAVDFDSDDSNTSGGGPKKRRRLTHLSPDEKLLRRKLKNRVAAQTARDRKKALMAELEEKVSQLEEENKLLKRQNFTLKEASSTLAKENATLKSQLADQPLTTTTKTDSETTSTRCSSAEGAGSDSVSVGGSVLHLCGNPQPDDFMGLLQELAEDSKCKQSQAQAATSLSQSIDGGDNCTDNSVKANHRTTSCGMVGLSPAELESLNELISIDHVYFKPQPINLQRGKEGQHKSSVAVRIHTSSGSIISPPQKCSSSLKRKQVCELSEKTISQPSVPSPASDAELDTVNHDFPLLQLSSSESLPSQESYSVVTDDFLNSLSDSDMESSLNFFQDLDFNLIESNIAADEPKTDSHIYLNNTQDITPSDDILENELNATKLFDEIYEHYLNIKETSSPGSAILSDSGISSDLDIDAVSPQSIEESLHDEMWHDTSFADLFPDLQ